MLARTFAFNLIITILYFYQIWEGDCLPEAVLEAGASAVLAAFCHPLAAAEIVARTAAADLDWRQTDFVTIVASKYFYVINLDILKVNYFFVHNVKFEYIVITKTLKIMRYSQNGLN